MANRVYSTKTKTAIALFGAQIRLARKQHKLTTVEVSERAGISRFTLKRIENGDLKSEIGLYFEVATVVGVDLFDSSVSDLPHRLHNIQEKSALLGQRVSKPRRAVKDDF